MAGAVALFVLLFVGIIVFSVVMRGNFEKTLRGLAAPWGWSYERVRDGFGVGAGHYVRGFLDGRAFELVVAPDGSGVLQETWSIQLAGVLPGGFAAGKNGWLRSASQGMARVTTGDAAFDDKVFAEGWNPQEAWHVLAADHRRAALWDLAALNAVVHDNRITLQKSGFDNNTAKLDQRLQRLRAIAQALDPVTPQQVPMFMQPR